MEKVYNVPSERYGHVHKFVQIEGDLYSFVPEQDWMPIYATMNDNGDIDFIDTDGGPCISVGFKTDKVEVTKIESIGLGEVFTLKEIDGNKE